MGIKEYAQEIVNTWMIVVNEQRELTKDEVDYILALQDKAIKEELASNDGLTDDELKAEYYSNKGVDIFGQLEN